MTRKVGVRVAVRVHKAEGGGVVLHLRTKHGIVPVPVPQLIPGDVLLTIPLVPVTFTRGGIDCPSIHLNLGLDEELILALDELAFALCYIDRQLEYRDGELQHWI